MAAPTERRPDLQEHVSEAVLVALVGKVLLTILIVGVLALIGLVTLVRKVF
jgi:hypothetical protein